MARHKLSKLEILEWAREGVKTQLGLSYASDDTDDLEKDLAEIERRIKLCEANPPKERNGP